MENIKTENILDALAWRYATKKFDTAKKLNADQTETLLSAVQLAPSSYGLQPYKIIVVINQEVKEKLKSAAFNQSQLADASHVFVFAIPKNFTTEHVDEYANNISEVRGIEVEAIQGFVEVMKGTVNTRNQEELANWNAKQAYIALGVLLESAALQGIDACPMEGFNNAEFDYILGLEEQGLTSVVIAPVGFRSAADAYQHLSKVRKSKEDLFIHI